MENISNEKEYIQAALFQKHQTKQRKKKNNMVLVDDS